MTSLQLKIAIKMYELGSISQAASELEISQPNASNYIKTLENEIGFLIFNRSKKGVSLTDKGKEFIEHAKKIILEQDTILEMKKYSSIYKLRVGGSNSTVCLRPFFKLLEMHKDDKEADFSCLSVSIEEGIKELVNYNLDIIFSPVLSSQLTGLNDACLKNDLKAIYVGDLPAVISVRKGHPAIEKGILENISQGSSLMKDYPYVSYNNFAKDNTATGYDDSNYIQSSYKIYVDESNARLNVLKSSNGFSFGMMLPKEIREKSGIVSYRVPGISLKIYCVVRKTFENRREIEEYISLLKEEIKTLELD